MVTVKASYIVKPAEPTPDKVMFLSDCDQIKPLTHAPTIYFYRPTTHKLLEEVVQILKDSLSKALVQFYPLAGRLNWTEGGRVELHCNSMGALLLEAQSELKIDDFGDFRPTPEIQALIPSVDYTTTPIHEVPLFLLQVTIFSCGGISLGLGMSHILIDGQSAVHFVTEWAKIARGENSGDHPFLDRTILQPKAEDHPPPTLKYTDFFRLPLLIGQTDNLEERKKETTTIMLKVSKQQIDAIKNKANQDLHGKEQIEALKEKSSLDLHNKEPKETVKNEADQDLLIKETIDETLKNKDNQDLHVKERIGILKNSKQQGFSRFEAVTAHIWKCASMARMLKPEQETTLFITVDFRNRLKPPLPPRYFGNAVMPVPVSSTVGDLLAKPLSYATSKIRQAIENVNDESVRSYLVCIKNIPNISNRRHFHTVGCSQGSFYGNPNMIITSWVGLPLCAAKFGWGDEVFLGPGSLGYDGRGFIIPSQIEDGSFLIPLRLQVEHMSTFERYFYEEI
ncbi:hypothetical protein ACH5RR_006551 [Cinchona calisaya]|uniref:Spermidine hydroxycinnamoyl transferase n=1 Tax=Cinchona calisaya TaxID=153742 RepID=A0ABD3APB3_9GENT